MLTSLSTPGGMVTVSERSTWTVPWPRQVEQGSVMTTPCPPQAPQGSLGPLDRFKQSHLPSAKWVDFKDVKASDLPSDKEAKLVFYCASEK